MQIYNYRFRTITTYGAHNHDNIKVEVGLGIPEPFKDKIKQLSNVVA